MSATVRPDSYLTLHYRLSTLDGEEFLSTFDMSPATLQLGSGQLAENLGVTIGELSVTDLLQHRGKLRVAGDDVAGVVASLFGLFDFGSGESKQEEVFLPCFLADFHIGAIQCADGERAIHHELHVASTVCLEPGR